MEYISLLYSSNYKLNILNNNTNYKMMMMMTEEKHTPNAISFVIEIPVSKVQEKSPEIKKRLEDQSAATAP